MFVWSDYLISLLSPIKEGSVVRREYDLVLRRRAIDLLESGKTVREIAGELEVSGQSIYIWRHQCRVDSG